MVRMFAELRAVSVARSAKSLRNRNEAADDGCGCGEQGYELHRRGWDGACDAGGSVADGFESGGAEVH